MRMLARSSRVSRWLRCTWVAWCFLPISLGHSDPPEVGASVRWDPDAETIVWEAAAGASSYNVYKGRVAGGIFQDTHTCHASDLVVPSCSAPCHPGRGAMFYYLVSAVGAAGEGSLGAESCGERRRTPESCPDSDGDGRADGVDNCPATPNFAQEDEDEDWRGDACDPCPLDPENDIDGDGHCAGADNCPEHDNPDQRDSDGDGTGDACEGVPPAPQIVSVPASHACGAWLVASPYAGAGTLRASRWWVSATPGPGFDDGVVFDHILEEATGTEIRALYQRCIGAGTLSARVAYRDDSGWSHRSEEHVYPATSLPADDGHLGARPGQPELHDPFDGPRRDDWSRPDNLDVGGALWPAGQSSPASGAGTPVYFALRDGEVEHPGGAAGAAAQTRRLAHPDSYLTVHLAPPAADPLHYDFSFGLRSAGTGWEHRSYRCKVERRIQGTSVQFNKYAGGGKGTAVAMEVLSLGAPPWWFRCEAVDEGDGVRLSLYRRSGGAWELLTTFLDDGQSGFANWDALPIIRETGGVIISGEKPDRLRYLEVRAGVLDGGG